METTHRDSVRFPRASLMILLRAGALLGLCIGLLGMHFIAVMGEAESAPFAATHSAPHVGPVHLNAGQATDCQTDCALEHSLGAACAAAFPLLVLALRRPKSYSRREAPITAALNVSARTFRGITTTPSLVELSISRT